MENLWPTAIDWKAESQYRIDVWLYDNEECAEIVLCVDRKEARDAIVNFSSRLNVRRIEIIEFGLQYKEYLEYDRGGNLDRFGSLLRDESAEEQMNVVELVHKHKE